MSDILKSFDDEQSKYIDFSDVLNRLIVTLLIEKSIVVHSVTHRCKTRQSLEKKISRPEKNYSSLYDITDISAVRITTYFADDVDVIAKIIQEEFSVDSVESVDKRVFDEPDRFGYLSLHFIAKINPERMQLTEYRRFSEMRFEIQIRSILQHAWAEIEHDLGYKSSIGVPANVKRRFARVAGLLELADSEFQLIRQSLADYEKKVPKAIREAPKTVKLDSASLRALLNNKSNVKDLDDIVASRVGYKINNRNDSFSSSVLPRLEFFGISTVAQLEDVAIKEAETVKSFAKYWLADSHESKVEGVFSSGIGLFYLAYVLAWRLMEIDKITSYLNIFPIGRAKEQKNIAKKIIEFKG